MKCKLLRIFPFVIFVNFFGWDLQMQNTMFEWWCIQHGEHRISSESRFWIYNPGFYLRVKGLPSTFSSQNQGFVLRIQAFSLESMVCPRNPGLVLIIQALFSESRVGPHKPYFVLKIYVFSSKYRLKELISMPKITCYIQIFVTFTCLTSPLLHTKNPFLPPAKTFFL